jgi:hypothetical protein
MNHPDRTVIYRVSRNGHVMGEFDIDRIVELIDAGEFLWTDLYWEQGMSAWAPMTNLRSEVLAAKAFPPVPATPRPVSSGRRGLPPVGASVAAPASASGFSGWWWVAGALLVGVLSGLITTHFFPTIVEVDRPVEKIVERVVEKVVEKPVEVVRTVEKPVEVVRMVDKIVEVPAALTPLQSASITFSQRLFDPSQRKSGISLFKLSNKVKVYEDFDGSGAHLVPTGVIVARVESIFRRQGFKVLSKDSQDFPFTAVSVGGVFLENKWSDGSVVGVTGSYQLELYQPVISFNPYEDVGPEKRLIMEGNVRMYERSGTLKYGNSNLYEIPTVYERLAEQGANDLRKAQDN